MDIEFDFKGDPIGGVITNCKLLATLSDSKAGILLKSISTLFILTYCTIFPPMALLFSQTCHYPQLQIFEIYKDLLNSILKHILFS